VFIQHLRRTMNHNNSLQRFMDIGEAFVHDFDDSQDHHSIANIIYHLLMDNIHYSRNQPDNPFNKYANINISIDETCNLLRADILDRIPFEEQYRRSLVRAFCAPNGVYRDDLEDLLEDYYLLSQNYEYP